MRRATYLSPTALNAVASTRAYPHIRSGVANQWSSRHSSRASGVSTNAQTRTLLTIVCLSRVSWQLRSGEVPTADRPDEVRTAAEDAAPLATLDPQRSD